jgi:hypothetical protein
VFCLDQFKGIDVGGEKHAIHSYSVMWAEQRVSSFDWRRDVGGKTHVGGVHDGASSLEASCVLVCSREEVERGRYAAIVKHRVIWAVCS